MTADRYAFLTKMLVFGIVLVVAIAIFPVHAGPVDSMPAVRGLYCLTIDVEVIVEINTPESFEMIGEVLKAGYGAFQEYMRV